MICPLIVIWLADIIVGARRQIYDTRLFSVLNAEMARKLVRDQRGDGDDVSEISARLDMIEELTEFLEEDMPVLMATFVGLVASLVFLALYDAGSGAIRLALMVPVLAFNAVTGLRAFRSNVALNSQWEKQVEAISDARPRQWRLHFWTHGAVAHPPLGSERGDMIALAAAGSGCGSDRAGARRDRDRRHGRNGGHDPLLRAADRIQDR